MKKVLSFVFALVMIIAALPISTYAETKAAAPEYSGTSITVNKKDAWGSYRGWYYYKTWTGKPITPEVKLFQEYRQLVNGRWEFEPRYLVEGKDYVKSFGNNTDMGHCRIKIKGKGKYSKTDLVDLASTYCLDKLTEEEYLDIEKSGFAPGPVFVIRPLGTKLGKMTGQKKGFKATWKRQAKKMSVNRITGYQIQYAKYPDLFDLGYGYKTVSVKGYKNTTLTVKDLEPKRKYYVRVRTYYRCKDGFKAYSTWSEIKAVKTK
ncbi:MAG: fibronectin type III domain-containing protein [Eubacterium sp.]|nr:fibronectin type III domain-containing protein [Eubacterium sp.]MBR0413125.1 fibronectin type III domain-containing protein [Eubacterium sp.]